MFVEVIYLSVRHVYQRNVEWVRGGGHVLRDPDISKYNYRDIGITLTEDTVRSILDGTMDQLEVNKRLLTAIVAVNNTIAVQSNITDKIIERLAVQSKITDKITERLAVQ